MKRTIVITGTPGTGKTTIAKSLSEKIKGSNLINVNELISEKKLFSGYDADGSKIVKMNELERELNATASKNKGLVIIEGHILCDLRVKGAVAIVIRSHLNKLKARLMRRRYDIQKIKDNLVSEAMNYCGEHARSNYRNVYEVLDDKNSIKRILDITKNKHGNAKRIELLEELADIIKEDKRFAI